MKPRCNAALRRAVRLQKHVGEIRALRYFFHTRLLISFGSAQFRTLLARRDRSSGIVVNAVVIQKTCSGPRIHSRIGFVRIVPVEMGEGSFGAIDDSRVARTCMPVQGDQSAEEVARETISGFINLSLTKHSVIRAKYRRDVV